MLMGGGCSYSTGGPRKGMHSRLYLRILSNYHQIDSFTAFNSIYNHSGLFGIHAITSPDFALKAVDLAAGELLEVATPGKGCSIRRHWEVDFDLWGKETHRVFLERS